MRHLKRRDVDIRRLLRTSRTVAVVGASADRAHRSRATIDYLRQAGFAYLERAEPWR